MIIANLSTVINPNDLNPVSVLWDLEVSGDQLEQREVKKIHTVELVLFDKYGIDVSEYFLGLAHSPALRGRIESALLDEVEFQNINELSNL